MTTVIADFHKKTMVADTRCSYAGNHFQMKKIFMMPNGDLVGFSGNVDEAKKFVAWFKSGANEKKPPTFGEEFFNILILCKDGLYLWDAKLCGLKIENGAFAIGSGANFALGAYRAGATLERAVEIAVMEDPCSGLPCESMAFCSKKLPPVRKTAPKVAKQKSHS